MVEYIQVRENLASILERDKTLRSLRKYESTYSWGKFWRTRVVNHTACQFVGSNLGVEIFLKKREHQKKMRWNRRLRLLCTLCIGVSKKFHLHFTLMFELTYYKMVQSLCKNRLLLVWTSPNYVRYFWNHKSFFTTQLLCIFLAQTLHTFYKSSPSKCKFSDFPLLWLKCNKFLMSFFKQKVSFSSKFGSFSSVERDNSSIIF